MINSVIGVNKLCRQIDEKYERLFFHLVDYSRTVYSEKVSRYFEFRFSFARNLKFSTY